MRANRSISFWGIVHGGVLSLLLASSPCTSDADLDGDGFGADSGDCDDSEPSVYPGHPEVCDGLDNDCNQQIDDGLEPTVIFTSVPPVCAGDAACYLSGRACGSAADLYGVAVYIQVPDYGWVNKPSFASPMTPLEASGAFTADVCTGGADTTAIDYCAFLLPLAESVPLLEGSSALPESLLSAPHACVPREQARRTLSFAGYSFAVKTSCGAQVSPGPCVYSDSEEDVFVDDSGALHLRATASAASRICTEVMLLEALGMGEYRFTLESDLSEQPAALVSALFQYDAQDEAPYQEIDLEFSQWGNPLDAHNAQYVVQPFDSAYRYRFSMDDSAPSIHLWRWTPSDALFGSFRGTVPWQLEAQIACGEFSSGLVPDEGNAVARANLWWYQGGASAPLGEAERVISHFEFIPAEDLPPAACTAP